MLGLVGSTPIKQAHYCASKGAVVNLTRELGAAVGAQGRPGQRAVPRLVPERDDRRDGDRRGRRRFIGQNSPIPRMGFEHELDAALLLLAGPGSTFMTGQSLIVDGGWTAR